MIRLGFSEKKHTGKHTDLEIIQVYAYQMHVEFFAKIWCFIQTLIRIIEDKQGPRSWRAGVIWTSCCKCSGCQEHNRVSFSPSWSAWREGLAWRLWLRGLASLVSTGIGFSAVQPPWRQPQVGVGGDTGDHRDQPCEWQQAADIWVFSWLVLGSKNHFHFLQKCFYLYQELGTFMFLAMSINTENSQDFLLWDISIFKNTVGSHRHLMNTTAAPAVAPVQVLFLQPSSPGVTATGRAWLLPAYPSRGGQQWLCSAHRTESQLLSEALICGWHLSQFPAMEHSLTRLFKNGWKGKIGDFLVKCVF